MLSICVLLRPFGHFVQTGVLRKILNAGANTVSFAMKFITVILSLFIPEIVPALNPSFLSAIISAFLEQTLYFCALDFFLDIHTFTSLLLIIRYHTLWRKQNPLYCRNLIWLNRLIILSLHRWQFFCFMNIQ